MLDDVRQRGYHPRTLGGDKGYDTPGVCEGHAQPWCDAPRGPERTRSAIDGRTTRHAGYRSEPEGFASGWRRYSGG